MLMDGLFDGAAVALGCNATRINVELTISRKVTKSANLGFRCLPTAEFFNLEARILSDNSRGHIYEFGAGLTTAQF